MFEYPETLSKFCTAETATRILTSHTLRWSSPHLFGDPFELDHRTGLSFDPHLLLNEVVRTTIAMIFSPSAPHGNSPLMNGIRRWRDDGRFETPAEAEASAALMELLSKMVDQRQADIDILMADWRHFTRHLRICSFSAKPDNLACWQRHADNHRGAVIRFHVHELGINPDAADAVRPIEYRQIRPEITTIKEQLNAAIYAEKPDLQAGFLDKLLCKSSIASSEQEWRCFYHALTEPSSKSNNDMDWFDDRSFLSKAVSAIYLGAYMSVEDKKVLLDMQREYYPNAKILQAQPVHGKYDVEFVKVAR
ncbi:DUF2971 domain-containing protein [Cellvibrio sp. ARAG 10.3]|uniref:DUF2971 domain-containing protein n=1 Tax=Cellvibrio sp. ARAG 10.3 TaxID=3451358 RepID=UPI003F448CDA